MKLLKNNLKLYLIIGGILFLVIFIVLFFYLSSPTNTGGGVIQITDSKTFLVNTKKEVSTFNYSLNIDLSETLKDIKFYQYKDGENIELKSKVVSKYSLDSKKLPSVKVIDTKQVSLFDDHVEIFKQVSLVQGDFVIWDADKRLKDLIASSLNEYNITIPETYKINKSYLLDDGNEAKSVSKDKANLILLMLTFNNTTETPITFILNQNGDAQKILLSKEITILEKEEVNLGMKTLEPVFFSRTNIDKYGSFVSYLPDTLVDITVSEIIYIKASDNLLVPFLRLSDSDNTVSITIPVIDPTRIIYK